MYESDKVIGMTYSEAVRFLDEADLWDEAVLLVLDCHNIVTEVLR